MQYMVWGDHATGKELGTGMGGRASPISGMLARPSAGGSLVPVLPSAVPEISQLHLLAPRPGLQRLRTREGVGEGELVG